MRNTLRTFTYALILIFCSAQLTSCNKDSDLLSDYVLNEELEAISMLVVNDNFSVTQGQPTVLDVLRNDQFADMDNVAIVSTTTPQNGIVSINEDNTLTYTPKVEIPETPQEVTPEAVTDTFTYTAEQTTESGEAIRENGTVNINNNKVPTTGTNVYYVTIDGKSANNGKSEATSWNLAHAFKAAKPGDIIHVKSGNYGALQINTSRSGTADNPIKFLGYNRTPQDIIATNGTTYTYEDWKNDGNALPNNIMPHLELSPNNNNPNDGDNAFEIRHSYIEIHNFFISKYRVGININASNVTINNCIGSQFGNWSTSAKGWNATQDDFSYTHRNGYGINLNGDNATLKNNLFIDAGFVTYFIKSDNNLIENCIGVAHRSGNGADYIFDHYGASNNRINNCKAIRNYGNGQGHVSRCNTFQARSDNNIMTNFTCVNARMQIENSNNNKIEGLEMYTKNGADGENSVSFQIYAQSDNNIILNYSITGGGGISFLGELTSENPRAAKSSGNNNYFINGKISNLKDVNGNALISFHRLGRNNGITAGTNYIIGLTADDFQWIINANRPGIINIYNSSFSNGAKGTMDTFYSGWPNATGNYSVNFENSNFYNNGFANPEGKNISSGNPQLTSNLNPSTGSALIGKGMNTSTIKQEAATDFDGNQRNVPYDIGAYKF